MDDTPLKCARHPTVETYLRCSRCESPICPKCLVYTPVGTRCATCADLRRLPVYEVGPLYLLRGLAAGLAVGLAGGAVLGLVRFGAWLLMPLLGYLVGEAVSAAANRKRHLSLALVAVVSTVLGIAGGGSVLLFLASQGSLPPWLVLLATLEATLRSPVWLLLMAVASFIAWSRTR